MKPVSVNNFYTIITNCNHAIVAEAVKQICTSSFTRNLVASFQTYYLQKSITLAPAFHYYSHFSRAYVWAQSCMQIKLINNEKESMFRATRKCFHLGSCQPSSFFPSLLTLTEKMLHAVLCLLIT